MDHSDTIVQIGGAIKHCPLPSLTTCTVEDDEPHDKRNALRGGDNLAIGGFIGDGQLAWRALGPTVEVLDPSTCCRQAAWTFGAILHNTSPVVTCVCSIGIGSITHIVIGVDLGSEQNPQGMVGVLSLRRSRIIRAFHFRHKVTSVCMIAGGEKVVDPGTLANELRPCQGLVAVGTAFASLYLIDLALDLGDEITSDEMCPATLTGICVPSTVPDLKRKEIIATRSHPMLCLSENINDGKTFRLLGPDDNILYETASRSVTISSLLYIPQLASLVVGYSFGSFQMMNLNLITIDCASPYEENLPPVFSFAYQEPENDPRSFVYLWVCRSPFSVNQKEKGNYASIDKTSTCSMYAMSYEKKEWIEGHGLWYQGLLSVSPRFDFDATGDVGSKVRDVSHSRIVSATTVVGTSPSSNVAPLAPFIGDTLAASDEEAEPVPELSLCLFCWEATVLDRGQVVTQHFIAIFDINQWYQSQMPSRLRLGREELCPYMSFHTLDRVPKSVNETLLGGAPSRGTWSRHSSRSHSEKEWFPSSLSYVFNLLTSEGLASYRCPSVQQSALSALVQQGPGAIVNPHAAFNVCVFSGILSSLDTYADGVGSSTVSEREQLLDTALEYHLLSLLVQCVVEFSEGKFSHVGCSSQFLLEWAWKRMKDIKSSSDALCAPLFASASEDCDTLSSQCLVSLHQNLTFLSHLTTVITAIRDNAGEVTSLSAGELEGRVQVANLLQLHLQATLWFYHCGLLPQCSPENAPDDTSVPFPAETLSNVYESRRSEIKGLGWSIGEGDLLLIDSIMEECGDLLTEVWEREDSGKSDGALYPPPSLHALLSMYLLPGIPTHTKHRIVQYLFLDLASLLSENYSNVLEELVKYPSSFSLSPSLIKLTQAFWLIDNKDFQAGLSVLLDPLVSPSDVTPSQHRRIIKAFLYQGEESHALTYTQIRRPPKHELEDIRINLTLLLANGRIREAFHYQRSYRVAANTRELLWHFFNGCEQLSRLESVVHLPLSQMEESSFVSYLAASQHPSAQDILLVYYLQQSRYEKISSLHEAGLKNNSTLKGQRRHKTRAALMQGYISHLPDVRAQIAAAGSLKTRPVRTIYSKPQPLSAHIRQSSSAFHTPRSKAATFRSPPISDSPRAFFAPYTPFRSKAERRRAAFKTWDIETHNHAQEPTKSDMELTNVVFPTRVTEMEDEPHSLLTPPLFNVASRIATPLSSRRLSRGTCETNLLQEDVSRIMEDVLRESMKLSKSSFLSDSKAASSLPKMNLSSEVVSLLKTPPVRRRSLAKLTPAANSLPETPQSILKVRNILQHSQSAAAADSESSSVMSFPRLRSSTKSNREKSLDKSSVTTESGGALTPKQLRFDLPISRRFSIDGAREEEEEEEEDYRETVEVGEPIRRPLYPPPPQQRKRKRSESPPPQHSSTSSNQPTPRKALPSYREGIKSENKSRLSSDDFEKEEEDEEEEDVVSTKLTLHENVMNSVLSDSSPELSSLNKYKSLSEVKDSSRLSPKKKSNVISMVVDTPTTTVGSVIDKGVSMLPAGSPTLMKKAEFESTCINTILSSGEAHKDPPHDESESFQDESFHSVEEEYQLEKRRESDHVFGERLNQNSPRLHPDTSLISPKISPRNDSEPKQSTVSVTYSHREIVETSDHGMESIEKTYRVVYNSSPRESSGLMAESSESPSYAIKDIPSAMEDENSDDQRSQNSASAEGDNELGNEISDAKDPSFTINPIAIADRNKETQDDDDLEASYELKFSDSEEEEESPKTVIPEREENRPPAVDVCEDSNRSNSPLPKSLSKQDTVLLSPHETSLRTQDNNTLSSSKSAAKGNIFETIVNNALPVSADCQADTTHTAGSLPLDLLNVPSLHLTTKEKEIVDLMLKGNHSLSLKNFNNRSQQEEETESPSDNSYIPVLSFSDDEEEKEFEKVKETVEKEELDKEEDMKEERNNVDRDIEKEEEKSIEERDIKEREKSNGERDIEEKEEKGNGERDTEEKEKCDIEEMNEEENVIKEKENVNEEDIEEREKDVEEIDETNLEDKKELKEVDTRMKKTENLVNEKENWSMDEQKMEKSSHDVLPVPNGPHSLLTHLSDGYNTDDSDKTIEFDLNQVPLILSNSMNKPDRVASPLPMVVEEEDDVERVDEGDQGRSTQDEETAVDLLPQLSNNNTIPSKRDAPEETTSLPCEPPLHHKEETREGSVSPLRLESSPDNNNIRKESPVQKTPSRKALKMEEDEEKLFTPSRRSRRLSGLTPETKHEAVKLTTPTTPLRRSSRRQGSSDVSTPILTPKTTPTRRQRRVSGASESGADVTSTPLESRESERKKRPRKENSTKSEAAAAAVAALTPKVVSAVLESPPLLPSSELRSLASEGEKTSPPPSEGRKKTPKGARTPPVPRKDTPRRRSARISGAADILGTIVEDDTEMLTPLTPTPTPKKTPLKAAPTDDQKAIIPSKGSPGGGLAATRSRRKSSHHAASEVLLETIREDSELSSSTPEPPSQEPPPAVVTATPNPSTPSRRSRRRSVSSVGDPATDDKENATRLESPTGDGALDALPVARRTRRASLSSNVSESPPEKSFLKTLEDHSTTKEFGADASSCPSPLPNYTFISPGDTSEKIVTSRKISYLSSTMSVLFPNAKHSSLSSGRKSLKSLPIPSGYEFTLDETPVTKRKPRRRKTASGFSSSILVLNSGDDHERTNDAVFEDEGDSVSLRLEPIDQEHQSDGIANPPTPGPLYHLMETSQEIPLKLPRRVSRPKSRSSYRRGITSMKSLGGSCDEEADVGDEEKTKKAPKKMRSSSAKDVKAVEDAATPLRGLPSEEAQQGFVFQKPEEILSTAEAVSEAFKKLTQEHEKMISETFVFSPPLSLDENRRKKRLEKRKSRK